MECLMFFIILFGVSIDFISAQLSISETLVNKTFCELSSVSIDCGTSNVIAIQQVQYGYSTRCSTRCCQSKESGDCLVTVTDFTDLKRVCSGWSSCTLPVVSSHDFCSFGRQTVSYVYFEYYCLPKSRITSVCSSTTITSAGEPLYLTNEGYPGATIGTRFCSCSLEAKSCSIGTSSFIIDADLYSEPNNCLQSLSILDSNNTVIESIQCENYYNGFVKQNNLPSNYIKIKFDSISAQNLEGYFFMGFKASESGVPFSLTCSSISATWCIDCSLPNNITNGIVALDTPNKFGYNSTATVTCYPGFNANTTRIVCKERGIWESASCTPKDCGLPRNITNGFITLHVAAQTIYNSSATVTCNTGFNATATRILCTENGTWESATCVLKDCGMPKNITNGILTLDVPAQTVYNSTATVTCNTGFDATATKIKCTDNGTWENASCIPKAACGSAQWQCQNGQCISDSLRCDNAADCSDGTDEQNCTGTGNCNEDWRKCFHSDGTYTCTDPAIPCDCGLPGSILHGTATLDVTGNSSSGASATVTCNNGYQTSSPTLTCLSTGLWTNTSCTGKDCGQLPAISDGRLVLADPKNSTYGASATVTCFTGYRANVSSISCLASASWESASCTVIECGPVVNISFGVIRLTDNNNVSYGAEALVECEDEFFADKLVIRCLASGEWEAALCTALELTNAPATTPDNNNNWIIIIVLVSVFGGAFVIQLIVATCLHILIYSKYTSDAGKVVGYISLSAIPFIGIYFIVRFYKWGGYKKYHMDEKQNYRNTYLTSRRFTNDHSGNGHTTFQNLGYNAGIVPEQSRSITKLNSYDNSENVHEEDKRNDEANYDNSTNYDNATHHDDIILDHGEHNPDSKKTNHQTMTRGFSAVLSSHTDLTDVGKPYEHLHPQRKDSDHYTKLHAGTLHEISHDHGNHILEERRKSRSGHVEFH